MPRIDDAPGMTTCVTVPGFVITVIGRSAPAVRGISVAAAAITVWYTAASAKEGVQLSAPRTIGAEREKSATSSSPRTVRSTVIGTSRTSIPSESRWSVKLTVPAGQLAQGAVADVAGRDLRGEVAEELARDAHVRAQDLEELLHRPAAVVEPEPRQPQALLEDLGAVARARAG